MGKVNQFGGDIKNVSNLEMKFPVIFEDPGSTILLLQEYKLV
jgi:hypothetical protein